jgi:hypothetical protein
MSAPRMAANGFMNGLLHEFLQGTCGFAGLLLRAISKVLRLDIEARDVNSFNLNLAMELAA